MSARISMEFSTVQSPTVVGGHLRLVSALPRSGPNDRVEQAAEPRHSFGLLALRAPPASGILTTLIPVAFVCAAFGYFACVCLTGWSQVSWL